MGKRKSQRRTADHAPVIAERHGFDAGGLLGHEAGEYAVNVTEQIALAVDVVFACVRTIADLTSDADVGEYRGNERLPDSRMTRRPMASVTRRTWLWNVTATMALYSGCYLWRRFGRDAEGVPISLVPVAPPAVTWQDNATVQVNGRFANPDDLVWVPRMSFPTLSRETSWLLRLARETIAAAWAADAYSARFWESGGAPLLYLATDQPLSNTDADTIQDRWTTKRAENPGKVAVLGKGVEPKVLGADLGTDGAGRAMSQTGSSIARYFGVPAWLVNVPTEAGSLTYANASAAGLDLVRYTLQPGYAGPIGDALSDELPGDYLAGRRVVLNLGHLTRGTQLEQFQAYQIATGQRPWMLPSEVRAELHMPMDMTLDEDGAPAPAIEQIPAEV